MLVSRGRGGQTPLGAVPAHPAMAFLLHKNTSPKAEVAKKYISKSSFLEEDFVKEMLKKKKLAVDLLPPREGIQQHSNTSTAEELHPGSCCCDLLRRPSPGNLAARTEWLYWFQQPGWTFLLVCLCASARR